MPAADQPTLSPYDSLTSWSSASPANNFLSSLTSKPTLPSCTPWLSLQPDHSKGNRSQNRGCPQDPSGPTSKWRWQSSEDTTSTVSGLFLWKCQRIKNLYNLKKILKSHMCQMWLDLRHAPLQLPSPRGPEVIWLWFKKKKRLSELCSNQRSS